MSKLDLSKPLQTRDGREAGALLAPDGFLYGWYRSGKLVSGLARGKWDAMGRHWPAARDYPPPPSEAIGYQTSEDLVNVPKKRTVSLWINVFDRPSTPYMAFHNRDNADNACCHLGDLRTACVGVTFTYTVGEGLEP